MSSVLFPTTVVGSYPQPDWLVNRDVLKSIRVPRIHAPEIWRPEAQFLEAAQDDATVLAIRDMETAGIDIVSDGEIRRESYSNRFALMLDGVDAENPAEIVGRTGTKGKVPRVVGPIRRTGPVEVRDAAFLRANTKRMAKITLPGPFTMAQQCKSDYYSDNEEMALAFADAVNAELRDIKETGVDIVQLDEPWLQARPEEARRYGVKAINRALDGVPGVRIVHLCFGYAHAVSNKETGYSFLPELADCAADQVSIEAAQPNLDLGVLRDLANKTILLGVLDLGSREVESAQAVAARIERALPFLPPERLVPAPDCGMKYLSRDVAFGKLKALADGAALARGRLS
jgi:5-methyltetrahydropteroyltriglutamate--homocysteine methyltransferase